MRYYLFQSKPYKRMTLVSITDNPIDALNAAYNRGAPFDEHENDEYLFRLMDPSINSIFILVPGDDGDPELEYSFTIRKIEEKNK